MDHYPVKVLLAAVLCLGVTGAAEASDLLGQSYVSLESLETGSGFRKLLVEEEPSEAIRRAVIRDMDIPRDQWKDTKYSCHRVDPSLLRRATPMEPPLSQIQPFFMRTRKVWPVARGEEKGRMASDRFVPSCDHKPQPLVPTK